MGFHHEMRYQDYVPSWVFFYCDVRPADGGQTPVAMSYPVYEEMREKDPKFVEKLEKVSGDDAEPAKGAGLCERLRPGEDA